ncbi:kinase-like domain-containing protein [Rhizophagus irregularis DAOM 181602=DAOM 197198]|nr:kinase-like domain-containing protein [Rhizophagus irregularis DAOM 181602=DAOM 197198]
MEFTNDARKELFWIAYNRAYGLTDFNIHNTLLKRHEFRKQTILDDETLTNDEKAHAIKLLNRDFDYDRIMSAEGSERTTRICENCQEECVAITYCECCIRNYLKSNFSNWTSGDNKIDDLIRKCQMETVRPNKIIEWIPYDSLQNIQHFAEGGYSKIYTADFIGGFYYDWDSDEKRLKKGSTCEVVLKSLNVENADRRWFKESKSHLSISVKWVDVVRCFGMTKNPSGTYMLVMDKMNIDLRNFLYQNHTKITWKRRISIAFDIVHALHRIHSENAIHRDLHSGNILELNERFFIGDLGFCGPASKPFNSVYGNLPYIAPEVLIAKETTTFASDIYSVGILMWEISSGRPPFNNCSHDYDLVMKIVNGSRPKIVSGTPLKYKELMEQCWDADPTKRPKINFLKAEMEELNTSWFYDENQEQIISDDDNKSIYSDYYESRKYYTTSTSSIYQFGTYSEPKNALEREFHSNYSFNIPSSNSKNIMLNINDSSDKKKNDLKLCGLLKSILKKTKNKFKNNKV